MSRGGSAAEAPLQPARALLVAYDGAGFAGWQEQPDRPTVQGSLRRALATVHGVAASEIALVGAGRTDAGVHAIGQVASYHPPTPRPAPVLLRALSGLLPASIRVLDARDVPPRFHALRSATGKLYRYRIVNRAIMLPFEAGRAWHVPRQLAAAPMREAAARLVGVRDFASFASAGGTSRSTTRDLRRLDVFEQAGGSLTIEAEADGFLYQMVRNIVGLLVEVGAGTRSAHSVPELLAARRRAALGVAAPPGGLCLVRVAYEPGGEPFPRSGD